MNGLGLRNTTVVNSSSLVGISDNSIVNGNESSSFLNNCLNFKKHSRTLFGTEKLLPPKLLKITPNLVIFLAPGVAGYRRIFRHETWSGNTVIFSNKKVHLNLVDTFIPVYSWYYF